MSPTAPVVPFSNLLATVIFKKCNSLKNYECGVTGVLCRRIKRESILSLCEPPYLRDLTKIPFKKPIDSGTMEPEVLKC